MIINIIITVLTIKNIIITTHITISSLPFSQSSWLLLLCFLLIKIISTIIIIINIIMKKNKITTINFLINIALDN